MSPFHRARFLRRSFVALTAVAIAATTCVVTSGRSTISASEASPRRGALAGTIATPDAVPVIAPVGGAVITVAVEEGATVRRGDVLAVLAHDDTKLVAPVSGVISKRSVQRGSVVRPDGAAPFLIVPEAPLRVVVPIDAEASRGLRASSIATFTVGGEPKPAYKARFSSLRPDGAIDNAKPSKFLASFTVEGETKLRPGQAVDVTVKN